MNYHDKKQRAKDLCENTITRNLLPEALKGRRVGEHTITNVITSPDIIAVETDAIKDDDRAPRFLRFMIIRTVNPKYQDFQFQEHFK